MWSHINRAKLVWVSVLNTLYVEMHDVLEPGPQNFLNGLPVSATKHKYCIKPV